MKTRVLKKCLNISLDEVKHYTLNFPNQACDTTARIQFVISYTPLSQLSAIVEWFSNFSSWNKAWSFTSVHWLGSWYIFVRLICEELFKYSKMTRDAIWHRSMTDTQTRSKYVVPNMMLRMLITSGKISPLIVSTNAVLSNSVKERKYHFKSVLSPIPSKSGHVISIALIVKLGKCSRHFTHIKVQECSYN